MPDTSVPAFWWIVVPLKDTRLGKSRLRVDPPTRVALARAMARDTLDAILATPGVDRVVLVCEDPTDATLLEDPRLIAHLDTTRRGLNPAITAGATLARSLAPGAHLAALPADLPGLTRTDLAAALQAAAAHPRAFLPDAAGVGTTLLTAAPGHRLDPRYGPHSRAHHAASSAVELTGTGLDAIRRDVDDLDSLGTVVTESPDLRTARVLGATPSPLTRV
jgi:2-phospho-L-lactate/phosphoenolpyruvate guanylyltransferase